MKNKRWGPFSNELFTLATWTKKCLDVPDYFVVTCFVFYYFILLSLFCCFVVKKICHIVLHRCFWICTQMFQSSWSKQTNSINNCRGIQIHTAELLQERGSGWVTDGVHLPWNCFQEVAAMSLMTRRGSCEALTVYSDSSSAWWGCSPQDVTYCVRWAEGALRCETLGLV